MRLGQDASVLLLLVVISPGVILGQDEPPVLPETKVLGTPLPSSLSGSSGSAFDRATGALRSSRAAQNDPRHTSVLDLEALRRRQPLDMVQAVEREVGVLVQRTGRGQASPFPVSYTHLTLPTTPYV